MYRDLNRVDTLTASQALRRLRDLRLLDQKGRGSSTYYVPTAQLLDAGAKGNPDAAGAGALSSDPDGLSSKPAALSSNLLALSSNSLFQKLPPELREILAALGQRAAPETVHRVIVALCRHRAWQAAELAALLHRNPAYLGTQYLRPMVAAGELVYTLPDQPNHPQQAYRAAFSRGAPA